MKSMHHYLKMTYIYQSVLHAIRRRFSRVTSCVLNTDRLMLVNPSKVIQLAKYRKYGYPPIDYTFSGLYG